MSVAATRADPMGNPKSLLDKLEVKPGRRIAVIAVKDAGFISDLRACVPDFAVGRPRAAGLRAGLVDEKVVRCSDTHGTLKFVVPVAKRARMQRPRRAAPRSRSTSRNTS